MRTRSPGTSAVRWPWRYVPRYEVEEVVRHPRSVPLDLQEPERGIRVHLHGVETFDDLADVTAGWPPRAGRPCGERRRALPGRGRPGRHLECPAALRWQSASRGQRKRKPGHPEIVR